VKDSILEALSSWLSAGRNRFGELLVSHCELRHYDDHDREDLELFTKPEAARLIAALDDADEYRPLKSAPNLRHGWKLELKDLNEIRLALDFFYPAMLGTLLAWEQNRLMATNFRDTVERQSGMYSVVKRIGNSQADQLIGGFCRHDTGCLKRIIWQIDQDRPITTLADQKFLPKLGASEATGGPGPEEIPMICCEACNLLVAAARRVVKQSQ